MNNKSYEIILAKVKGNSLEPKKIMDEKDAYEYAKNFYFDDIGIYESFFIICLNRANVAIGWSKISQGGTCGAYIDIKIIAKIAIDSLAQAVILVHNHPSGSLTPSKEDDNITKRISEALKLFDIKVLEHLIISEDNFYSYCKNGRL